MAQSLTITPTNGLLNWADNVLAKPGRMNLSWQSATGGTVSYGIAAEYAGAAGSKAHARGVSKVKGTIVKIVTNPGSTAPSAGYDISIYDKDGIDVCGGNLLNRSATLTEQYIPDPPLVVDSELTLSIADAGNTKVGEIEIYFQ